MTQGTGPSLRRLTIGRRVLTGGVAATLLLATLVGVLHLRKHGADGGTPSLGGATATGSPVAGHRVITFHGLSITVPASWALTVGEYCKNTTNTVVLPGISAACGHIDQPTLSTIEFYEGTSGLPLTNTTATVHATISGVPATRVEGSYEPRAAFGYLLPSLQASVLIRPARGLSGDDLAATLRVVAVDGNGCRSAVADAATLPAVTPSAGELPALVPDGADSLVVCRYVAGRLEQGTLITGARVPTISSTLDAQPAGTSRADPATYSAGMCRASSSLGTVDGETAADSESYRVEARYPSGNPVVVIARLGVCGLLGASNGRHSVQCTQALYALLAATVGNSVGGSGNLIAVPEPR